MKKKIRCLPKLLIHQRFAYWLLKVIVVLMYLISHPLSAKAEGSCPSIGDAIPLVPEIVEQSSKTITQDFYTTTLFVEFRPGQLAVLASTPDGKGSTRVDDRFWIQASPSGQEWSHDYRNSTRTQIVPFPAQDISHLFVVGKNTVNIRLTDLFGPNYSALPFYLVLLDTCPTPKPTETPTSENTSTPIPATHTATATPTVTPSESATTTEPPTLVSTQTTTPLPTNTVSPMPTPTPVAGATATESDTQTAIMKVTTVSSTHISATDPICCGALWLQISGLATSPFALGLTVACIAILWLFWRFLNQPKLSGLLKVENLDNGSIEIISLRQFGTKVSIGTDGQIRIVDEELPAIVGRIVVKREDSTVGVFWQSEDAQKSTDQTIEELRHGSVVQIGHYRLTYENLAEVTDDSELLDGGIWNEQEWA